MTRPCVARSFVDLVCGLASMYPASTSSSPDKSVPASASKTRSAGACPAGLSSLPGGRARDRAWPHAARRHPHSRELTGARQFGETDRIASVRLYPVAGFLRNERRSHHQALVAEALEQSVEPISRRPCFVAKRQMTVFRCKLAHKLSDRRVRWQGTPRDTAPRRHGRHRQLLLHCAILTCRFRQRLRCNAPRLALLV